MVADAGGVFPQIFAATSEQFYCVLKTAGGVLIDDALYVTALGPAATVGTVSIADGAVTTAKLADGSVTRAKLDADAIQFRAYGTIDSTGAYLGGAGIAGSVRNSVGNYTVTLSTVASVNSAIACALQSNTGGIAAAFATTTTITVITRTAADVLADRTFSIMLAWV